MKKLLNLSAALCMSLLISVASVMASAKMEVPLGETVSLQAQILQGGTDYKWAASKDGEIVTSQSGSFFTYTFDQQGEYIINLSAEDRSGETQFTKINVMVGDRYSQPPQNSSGDGSALNQPLVNVDAQTLPLTNSEKQVSILGDEGRVVFDLATHPDILEYRVDKNIFIDSDGNGVANDDIDNVADRSYLIGGIYQTTYDISEANKVTAEITAVTTTGQKLKRQIEILFDSYLVSDEAIQASLDTLPVQSEDGNIYLYGNKGSVAFYPRLTRGEVLEYRIDKNIFIDSNQDGDPANDIDNQSDSSFKNGDVWVTDYEDNDQQIIAQLIVVGTGGAGSRIQREIIFTDRPEPEVVPGQTGASIMLTADKDLVQVGDPIAYSVEGLSQSLDEYEFEWDFNGDGEVDQTTEGLNTVSFIYEQAGIQNVAVRVVDKSGNEATFSKEILVKDIDITEAVFDFEIDGNTVRFNDKSTVSANLSNKSLSYSWSFGDTDEANYQAQEDQLTSTNPLYTYKEPGTYLVTLTVTDSDQVTSTVTKELIIEGALGEEVAPTSENSAEQSSEGGSFIGSLFKIILYIILVIVLLVILIVGGLLGFLKIQHPDLVFSELIDELKIKLLSMMGIHEDMVYHDDEAPQDLHDPSDVQSVDTIIPSEPVSPVEPEEQISQPEEAPVEQPDLSKANGPTPDWLKTPAEPVTPELNKKEVIEAEVVEEMPVSPAEPAPEPVEAEKQENPFEKPVQKQEIEPESSSPLSEPAPVEPAPEPEPITPPEVKAPETPEPNEAEVVSPQVQATPIQVEEKQEPKPPLESPVESKAQAEVMPVEKSKEPRPNKPDLSKQKSDEPKPEAGEEGSSPKPRRRRRPRSRNRSRQNGPNSNPQATPPQANQNRSNPQGGQPSNQSEPKASGQKQAENQSTPKPEKPITPPDGDLSQNDGPVPDWLKQ